MNNGEMQGEEKKYFTLCCPRMACVIIRNRGIDKLCFSMSFIVKSDANNQFLFVCDD